MTQTTEGTGQGAVERYLPRILYNQKIKAENIVGLEHIIKETPPNKIDGGTLQALMMGLSEEDMSTILKAAEIIKKINNKS